MKRLATSFLILAVAVFVASCANKRQSDGHEPATRVAPYPANAGFEDVGKDNMPAQWEPFVIGAPAQFALDSGEKHSGKHSARVSATEVARSYFRSAPIAIAPGEKIHVSAWVKHKDVPPGKGTVILIAEFTDASDGNSSVAKVNTADTTAPSPGRSAQPAADRAAPRRRPTNTCPGSTRTPRAAAGWPRVAGR